MKNQDLEFEYIEDFVDYVMDRFDDDDDLFITVISKFNNMRDIIKDLISYCDDINFDRIDITAPKSCCYKDEDYLSLWIDDGVINIDCFPLKMDGNYISPCGDIIYLFDDSSSKIIPLCDSGDLYYVSISDEDDIQCDCCQDNDCVCGDRATVDYSKDEDGDLHGFTASKTTANSYYSFSYYTPDTIDKDDIHTMLKNVGF